MRVLLAVVRTSFEEALLPVYIYIISEQLSYADQQLLYWVVVLLHFVFNQIMLPFYGAGARLCLARALCEASASVGRFTSNTVLCASMAVKLLCNDQEVSSGGQFSWPEEIPRSLLSATLVQAVSLFPSPKYPLALGLLYHHKSAAEFLEGGNNNVEEVNSDCRRISITAACDVVQVLFKARLGGERSVFSGLKWLAYALFHCNFFIQDCVHLYMLYIIHHHSSGAKENV